MNPSGPPDIDLTGFGIAAFVFAIVALGFWWWRNRGGVAGGDAIRLLALRPLGGKRLVALIEVEEERFLLGMTDSQISCLGRLEGDRNAGASALDRGAAKEAAA